MSTLLIKLAVTLIAPALIVSSTATGQGEKPLPPNSADQALSLEAVPSIVMPSAFAYQGQLRQNNLPVSGTCSANFKLFDAESAGNQIGATVDIPALQVQNGLFNAALDFGWNAFNGEGRWLETAIGCGQRPVTLTPRTRINPTPYALSLPGMRTVPALLDNSNNPTMNVIGGLVNGPISNTITPDSYNSVIAGGINNHVVLSSISSIIVGGENNMINDRGERSVIAGGSGNRIDGYSTHTVIGGGYLNTIKADSDAAVIAGGGSNIIDNGANFAIIPGGYQARANFAGQQAFALGGFGGVAGTAQTSVYVLHNQTLDAQPTLLYLDGASAQISLPVGRGMIFDIQVIGETDAANQMDIATYHFIGGANNYGSNLTLFSTKTIMYEDAGALTWDVNVSRTDNTINIVVTGENNNPIRWVATVRTTEVEWPTSAMYVQNMPAPVMK